MCGEKCTLKTSVRVREDVGRVEEVGGVADVGSARKHGEVDRIIDGRHRNIESMTSRVRSWEREGRRAHLIQ